MTTLNQTLNPINAEERVKINQNWDRIMQRLSSLQGQINILSGEVSVEDILAELNSAISNANTTVQDLVNNTNQSIDNVNQKITEVDGKLVELQTAIDNANLATNATNSAITDARQAIADINAYFTNFRFVGEYNATTTYYNFNFVRYQKSTFVSLKENLGITPNDDGINWRLVAAGGIDGMGAVASVNGKNPDSNGEVTLIPADVGAASSDQINETNNNLSTLQRQVTTRIDVKYPPSPLVGATGDNTADDTAAFINIINYCIENGVELFISAGNYKISGELVLRDISITGTNKSVLNFIHSTGQALRIIGNNVYINNVIFNGNQSIDFMVFDGKEDGTQNAVDCYFEKIRANVFKTPVVSVYSWDIKFNSCRFHNCLNLPKLGIQTNLLTFDNCRFSSFLNGMELINCQLVKFKECDIVGYSLAPANEVLGYCYQSHVAFENSYFEHIDNFGAFGAYGEQARSSLMISGGIVLGTQSQLKLAINSQFESRINITGVDTDSIKLFKSTGVTHPPILINSYIDNDNFSLRTEYKGDAPITDTFVKISGGDVETTINNGYSTIAVGAYNGLVIDTNLTAGETYTVVIKYKSAERTFQILDTTGDATILHVANDWKTIYVPFVAVSNTFRIQNISDVMKMIDIEFIKIYNGMRIG